MNRTEAVDILETIQEIYPKYELTKRKANILIQTLSKMDYEGVSKNLVTYAAEKPFAPTISEIAAYPKPTEDPVKTQMEWEEKAKNVDPAIKQKFQQDMQRLVQKLGERHEN